MKKVYYKGNAITLTKEVGGGQEAVVFDGGNKRAVKIYRSSSDPYYVGNPSEQQASDYRLSLIQKKLLAYPRGLPHHVIVPTGLVTNKNGMIIGYTMPLIERATPLLQYSNRSFRENAGVDHNDMISILLHMHQTIQGIHATKTVIGDFNDMNVLIQNTEAYFIDTDSWQFAGYASQMFTQGFVDPLLCQVQTIPDGDEGFLLSHPHNMMGDWYAYNAIVFKSLLYTDIYGGTHKPTHRSQKIKTSLRPAHRITVFDENVIYPRPAIHWSMLPDDILDHFESVFVRDERKVFPVKLLKNMRWTTCTQCKTLHARHVCPSCAQANPNRVVQRISIRGKITAHRIFNSEGTILASYLSNNTIRYLYHHNDTFYREGKQPIHTGSLEVGVKYRIRDKDTIFASNHRAMVVGQDGSSHIIHVDQVGQLPIIDSTDKHIYWAQHGHIKRDHPLGLDYQPHMLGDVLVDQTLLWSDKGWGFGIWKMNAMVQGFIFYDDHKFINESLSLPPIHHNIIDAKAVFSATLVWFMYTNQQGSQRTNHCIVMNRSGVIVSTDQQDLGSQHWLGTIRGKDAAGSSLFCPSDEGLIRVDIDDDGVFSEKNYPDTRDFIDSQTTLHIAPQGIYAQNSQDIYFLSM